MEEKELTDEQIIKDIERSTGIPSYWKKIVLDLVQRLQNKNIELKEKIDAFIETEIRRLTEENKRLSLKVWNYERPVRAPFYSNESMVNCNLVTCYNENADLKAKNAELQKQVDELKEENAKLKQGKAIMLDGITDLNRLVQFPVEYEGKNFKDIAELGNYIQEQAVKDTVKEILQEGKYCLSKSLKNWIKEHYGVEVIK